MGPKSRDLLQSITNEKISNDELPFGYSIKSNILKAECIINRITYVGELGYNYFEGSDKPGDFRKEGTEFVPMEWVSDINFLSNPSERPIYYDNSSDRYLQWTSTAGWQDVNQSYFEKVLNNKQYIDMPNQSYYIFLNPRDIFIGINFSYDF